MSNAGEAARLPEALFFPSEQTESVGIHSEAGASGSSERNVSHHVRRDQS